MRPATTERGIYQKRHENTPGLLSTNKTMSTILRRMHMTGLGSYWYDDEYFRSTSEE